MSLHLHEMVTYLYAVVRNLLDSVLSIVYSGNQSPHTGDLAQHTVSFPRYDVRSEIFQTGSK
jgi:hypothetical protein